MSRPIDVLHLGCDRVICAYEVGGVIVDPGPASCVETLIDRLGPVQPHALLLTHIHLDHAGHGRSLQALSEAEGVRPPPGRAGPQRPVEALKSAGRRLYGDDMWFWGEVAPVPEERPPRRAAARPSRAFAWPTRRAMPRTTCRTCTKTATRSTATWPACIPPYDHTIAPTPPPDIDVEDWLDSLHTPPPGTRSRSVSRTSAGSPRWPTTCTACAPRSWNRPTRPPRGALRGAARGRLRPGHRRVLRAGGAAEPAVHGPRALLAQAREMSQTVGAARGRTRHRP